MKIRTDSWHYKLYERSYSQLQFPAQNTNLCKYFWRVIGGTLYVAFLATVLGAILGGIGFLFYKYTLVSFTVAGCIAAIIGLIFLYLYVAERLYDRAKLKRSQPGYQEPEPGFLRSYVRAKKEKVCPLITFVEEENA